MEQPFNYTFHAEPLLNLVNCIVHLEEKEVSMNAKMSLSEFVSVWLQVFKLNTVKDATYNRLLESKKVMDNFPIAAKKIGEINFFDLQHYINDLTEAGYGISTIKKELQIVTAPLRQAAAIRIIQADPSIGIRLPVQTKVHKKNKKINPYNNEEQARIWKVIGEEPDNAAYNCIAFMLQTGVRAGEALALRWKYVDLANHRFRVCATVINPIDRAKATVQESPKTQSSNRLVPIVGKTAKIIENCRYANETEWVFQKAGERLSYAALIYQTKRLCLAAEVEYRGAHVFRHTFATNCYYKQIDVKKLSKLLGHADVNITYNTYIDLYGDGFDDLYTALAF